ncbi:TetR family transcriptional regulator [Luteolibacter pohnpeiensis]|uniref:TetR family transcriptional regulator n=1 Tax=Luteolibacter pohnpeiensis TaxID=454153 RepID=A0A934VXT9_9BACT|nr:TetR/AcrR family transcriptional regulator [Luteolibacter pohnpeiensis]MBK1883834.1 TetR family transcriptional regulator [Luteolibacter pohnpeiensis]
MNQTVSYNAGGPKARLLEAAEKLFAEHGFEGVSVRDITKEASANVAAVNYHFGSRDGLVRAVVTKYVAPIHEERFLRLEEVEKKFGDNPVPVEDLLVAFVGPLLEQVRKTEGSSRLFGKILGRVFSVPGNTSREVDTGFDGLTVKFARALVKSVPYLSLDDAMWRLNLSVGAMTHVLIQSETPHRALRGYDSADDAVDEGIDHFIRFASAGIREGDPTKVPSDQKKEPKNFFGL